MTVHYRGPPAGSGDGRFRDLRHPVLRAARHRGPRHAVLAREAEGDPRAQLQRVGKILFQTRTASGSGRTASWAARPSPTCRSGASATRRSRTRTMSAARCSPRTPGARTRCAGAPWTRRSLIEQALEDVAQIHPSITKEFEVGAVQDWYDDPWARGAFALFEPEQQTRLQAIDRRARGPDPLRGRAHVAVPRVDPGCARVGHPRREGDPRGDRRSRVRCGERAGDRSVGQVRPHDVAPLLRPRGHAAVPLVSTLARVSHARW